MISHSNNTKQIPLDIVGSSTFGRYPKIDSSYTWNMFITDGFLSPYAGYQSVLQALGDIGRGAYASFNLNRLVIVIDNDVYAVTIVFNQEINNYQFSQTIVGNLTTYDKPVYIIENDTGQLAIVDGQNVYIYDPNQTNALTTTFTRSVNLIVLATTTAFTTGMRVVFTTAGTLPAPLIAGNIYYLVETANPLQYNVASTYEDATNATPVVITLTTAGTGTFTVTQYNPPFYTIPNLGFLPSYITFHDTYFICPADGTNQWRLGQYDSSAQVVHFNPLLTGFLQTKADQVQAVIRFPSRGNMIFVFGKTVVEPWFDTGGALFPYQRNDSSNIDYGCVNRATIAFMDEIVVWLGQNEKSGPVILKSDGGMPQKISTDGIDFLLYNLFHPEDSQAFLIRQDGRLFYHINFYTDNLSLFYDFNSDKFYNASDENMNYYIASSCAFFNEQYYFVTKNNGNLYAFDTAYYTYDGAEIPRMRQCKSIRLPTQENFIINDLGFTIEQGTTDYQFQDVGDEYLITEDGKLFVTEGDAIFLTSENNEFFQTEDDQNIVLEQVDATVFDYLVTNQGFQLQLTPRIDMAISYNGGQSFVMFQPYVMNSIGNYRNTLRWWQLGMANDFIPQFRFWGMGRFVCGPGICNIRQ